MFNKKCNICKKEKELKDFNYYKNRSGRQSTCRSCENNRSKKWYIRNKNHKVSKTREWKNKIKAIMSEYKKTLKCKDCGFSTLIYTDVMEFDHLDNKKHTISTMVSTGLSWENIMKEIKKCDSVCANCHRIRTQKRRMGILV